MNLSTERLLVRDLDRTDLTAVHRLLDVDSIPGWTTDPKTNGHAG